MSSTLIQFEQTVPSLPLISPEPDWYAVYTRARFEKKTADLLREKNVFTFLPLLQQLHRWSDRWSKVEVPAFACYTFVRIVATAANRVQILKTPGVLHFVGREGLGMAIPDEQIESLRTIFKENIPCAVHPFINVGRRVRIRGGSLHGIEGILAGHNADQSLVVSVELLGRSLAIRTEGYDIEPV